MFGKPLILLIFCGILSYGVYASESQCSLPLLKDVIDEIQSSIAAVLIKNAQILLDDANKYAATQARCSNVESICEKPMDCSDIIEKNASATNGVYKIWPRNLMINCPIDVYCDMEDDGGGWTVLQRRGAFGNRHDYFYRSWKSYRHGFGDLKKDFWLGNDNIFLLTNQRTNVVKIILTDWEGNTTYALFDDFWIDDETQKYRLHVTGYSGTAGNSLYRHNGQEFSTNDQDNDSDSKRNCAVELKGAWWYEGCSHSNLNGLHFKEAVTSDYNGIFWSSFRGTKYSLKDTVMKLRPYDFQKNRDNIQPH